MIAAAERVPIVWTGLSDSKLPPNLKRGPQYNRFFDLLPSGHGAGVLERLYRWPEALRVEPLPSRPERLFGG